MCSCGRTRPRFRFGIKVCRLEKVEAVRRRTDDQARNLGVEMNLLDVRLSLFQQVRRNVRIPRAESHSSFTTNLVHEQKLGRHVLHAGRSRHCRVCAVSSIFLKRQIPNCNLSSQQPKAPVRTILRNSPPGYKTYLVVGSSDRQSRLVRWMPLNRCDCVTMPLEIGNRSVTAP